MNDLTNFFLHFCDFFECEIDELETEFLPLNCNWIASNLLPKFDEIKDTFVEPYLPNYEIGTMHLAAGIWDGDKDMRLDKKIKILNSKLRKMSKINVQIIIKNQFRKNNNHRN